MCFLHNKTSSRSTQTRQKDDTKFVILNATFNIFKVNATGSVYRGCIYFENLLLKNSWNCLPNFSRRTLRCPVQYGKMQVSLNHTLYRFKIG